MKFIIAFLLVFVFIFAAFGQNEDAKFPNSIYGKRASSFWKVINSKDDSKLRSFIENEMTPSKSVSVEKRLQTFIQLRQILGGSKIVKVFAVKDNKISFIARNDAGDMGKISLTLDAKNENRISRIGLTEATENDLSDKPKKVLSESELVKSVDEYLKDLTEKDEFSGVVLIAKNGKPFYQKAFGYANIEYKVPNKIDTKFPIGSIDKTFTELAIGMLLDEGKISLGDKLGKFIPDYPNKEAKEKVTVKHLLEMTSGIGDIFGPKFFKAAKGNFRTLKDYMSVFASEPLLFEPGTKRKYSNGGYILLGLIIEKVSNQSYYDFVREKIFKPAGMENTSAYEIDTPIPNRATGYTLFGMKDKSSKKRKANILMLAAKGSSAGGGYSTALDLLKFANALENGKIRIPKSASDLKFGLGSAGGAPGLNASLETKVKGKYTVIVLSNYDPPIAEKVSEKIRRWLGQ